MLQVNNLSILLYILVMFIYMFNFLYVSVLPPETVKSAKIVMFFVFFLMRRDMVNFNSNKNISFQLCFTMLIQKHELPYISHKILENNNIIIKWKNVKAMTKQMSIMTKHYWYIFIILPLLLINVIVS